MSISYLYSFYPFVSVFSYIFAAMIFKVEHNPHIIGKLRRKWRKDGRFTVRVTHTGTVSVIRMPLHKDMKTEAQMRCRMRFVRAQEMMLEALADKKLRRFFQRRRLRRGYKTLRGCIRAYYIEQLIRQEQNDTRQALGDMMRSRLDEVERNIATCAVVARDEEPPAMCATALVTTEIIHRDAEPKPSCAVDADIGDG